MTTPAIATAWNPAQYDRFKAERTQPFLDLVDLLGPVPPGGRVVDLGCGTGELTATLVDRLGAAEVLGLDHAEAMLAEARPRATGGRLRFDRADIGAFHQPGAWDVVLANAALQWVPDHATVLARWVASLRPGGQLAVQVPANHDHPSHTVAAEVAASERFAHAFPTGPPPDPVAANVLTPEAYAVLLHELGMVDVCVRLQVYGHLLDGTADVVEWVKGTTLNRFKAALVPEVFAELVERYRVELLLRLGEQRPFFYPFKRILFCARVRTG